MKHFHVFLMGIACGGLVVGLALWVHRDALAPLRQNESGGVRAVQTVMPSGADAPRVCTDGPKARDVGGLEWPAAPSYRSYWLGQIFTADDCGVARLTQAFGGPDAAFAPGVRVVLEFPGAATVSELLKLKQFAPFIVSDDCIDCG